MIHHRAIHAGGTEIPLSIGGLERALGIRAEYQAHFTCYDCASA
jgi:hypothetical protein